jgi:parallel beta-helix repeat protein
MRRGTLLVLLAAGALGAAPTQALAATHVVHPGESIQAAVDAASPGDTVVVQPGVYHEAVVIQTDNLTLRGGGPGNFTTIVAPNKPKPNACGLGDPTPVAGICVLGQFDESFNLITPVVGTRITGFEVKKFPFGILNLGGQGTQIQDNRLAKNFEYGVFSNTSSDVRIVGNTATGSGAAGFYVGDSPSANATVFRNVADGNGFGFFFRDAAHGLAKANVAKNNCIGFLLLDTDAPGGVSNWDIRSNTVKNNSAACPAGEDGPPTSGAGIALVGATDTVVFGNTVLNNTPSGETVFSGGIVLVDGGIAGGGPLANDRVQANNAHGNSPDLFWDETGTAIQFFKNDCDTSVPDGLCRS